jgi:tetratricopeptide (TPR) repeat protein
MWTLLALGAGGRSLSEAPRDTNELPLSAAKRIDALCERFELAWQQAVAGGPRPRMEEFLSGARGAEPAALLRELLALEVAYRRRLGETPQGQEYQARFPDFDPAWLEQELATGGPAPPGGPTDRPDSYATRPWQPRAALPLWPCVPGYEVLDQLGRGGMGVVYKARQLTLNRVVALKMILAGSHAGPEDLARFRLEAEAIARLQHPNIVQIHEVGEHEGLPFFSLEFCPGGSLDEKLGGMPLPSAEAARLVQTLARAVQAAHERHVVHRDLKPANVLLTADGTLKITDFGLAKKLDQVGRTGSGTAIMGTPPYMAPEQARGKSKEIGPATDVYALGAILYECLTGRPPFQAATTADTLLQVLTEEPVPVRRLQPTVPRDLETVCLKCLQKEPGQRYGSAADLADDLGWFLVGEPIRARPVPAWERAVKWARRRPTAAALAVAVAVAVLAASAGGLFYGLYTGQQATALRRQVERRQQAERLFGQGRDAETAGRLALAGRQEDEAARQLEAADRLLEQALTVLDREEDELGAQIRQRRATIGADLDELTRRRQMRRRVEGLREDLDAVRFHTVSPAEKERADNLAQVRRLAKRALARFGVRVDRAAAEAVQALERERFASAGQRKQVAEGCYELLLAWAEADAEAGRLPGRPAAERAKGTRQALRLLDTAAALGRAHGVPAPLAYYQRRARYHAQAGEEKAAAAARLRAAGLRPQTALDHFLAALEDFRQGQTDRAAAACERALQQQNDHFWALYLQALCRLKARRWAEARAGFHACVSRRPDFLWPRLLRGVASAELKEFETAEVDFAWALGKAAGPLERYVVLTNRSVLWVRRQRYAAAVADLEAAVALRPDDHQAHLNLAEVYRRRHNLRRAVAAAAGGAAALSLAGVGDDLRRAVAALDRAVTCRPDDAELYHTRARVHLARNDWGRARRDLEAARRCPNRGDPERVAGRLVELGVLKEQAGELPEALADFDTALKLQPDYPPAHRQRAQALLKLKRYQEAGQALDRYLRHGTPAAEVYLARGLIHSHFREYRNAVRMYGLALLFGEDAEALTQRGWAYLQLEAPWLALDDFEVAERLRPKHAASLCGRGHALVLLGRLSESVRAGEEALRQKGTENGELLVACIYARAARLLAATPGKGKRGRERPEARYEERAAELLDAALRRVPAAERAAYWREHVQAEPALAALRRHPRVVRLAAGMGR